MNVNKVQRKQFARDDQKLTELIVYIAYKTADYKKFGRTHLNKVLAWSDFIMFANRGEPIIGGKYAKLDNGPVLEDYDTVISKLKKNDDIAEQVVSNVDFPTRKIVATREPDLSIFKGDEIAQVDKMIEFAKNKTARKLSKDSHDYFVGWNIVDFGEAIPYETVFLPTTYIPTETDVEYTKELAARLGW